MEVLRGVVHGEIAVADQVIGEKAQRILDGHLRPGQGQGPRLRRLEPGMAGEVAGGHGIEQLEVVVHVGLLTGVLGVMGGGCTDELAHVVPDMSRHGGVEIDHASGPTRLGAKSHVGQLGVIVDGAHHRTLIPGTESLRHLQTEPPGPAELVA